MKFVLYGYLTLALKKDTTLWDVTLCSLDIYRSSSEMFMNFYQTTRSHILEDSDLRAFRCENLKFNSAREDISFSLGEVGVHKLDKIYLRP